MDFTGDGTVIAIGGGMVKASLIPAGTQDILFVLRDRVCRY